MHKGIENQLETTYQAKDKNITGKAYGNITNREYNTHKKAITTSHIET